jgi:pimeloyl-ACP methyl ester carboxylesterase
MTISKRRSGRADTELLDLRITAAEDAAYDVHGLHRATKHLTVETGRGQTTVRVSVFGNPTAQPPVLLLHGVGSAQVLAAPLLPFLAGRQVFALDWPGHGLSGPCVLSPTQDMCDHASTVIESTLDELGLPLVDLVGHSMGAQFSLYAGITLPHRVRRLVLLGAPGAAFAGIRPLTVMKLLAVSRLGPLLLARPPSERAFDSLNDMALGAGSLDGHAEIRSALQVLAERTGNATSLASYFRAMIQRGRIRAGVSINERELSRVTQPTLLAWGDDDVFLKPLEAGRSIVAIRDAHHIRVPGVGHAPWLQATNLVGRSVQQHLTDTGAPMEEGMHSIGGRPVA